MIEQGGIAIAVEFLPVIEEKLSFEVVLNGLVKIIDVVFLGLPLLNNFFIAFKIHRKLPIHSRQFIISGRQELKIQSQYLLQHHISASEVDFPLVELFG